MMHMTFTDDRTGAKWYRVDARRARRAFLEGLTVLLCPCNFYPFGPWRPSYSVWRDDDAHAWELQHYGPAAVWEMITNEAAALNCSNEAGRYLSYYLQA